MKQLKTTLTLWLCTWLLTVPAAAQEVTRRTALQSAKNMVVTTTRGTTYYYLVSANSMPMLHLGDGTVNIGSDTFASTDIRGIRFRSLARAVLNEDSTSFDKTASLDHALLALRRTLHVGRWNTLVLPFDLTDSQLLDTFGEGTEVAAPRAISEDGVTTVELTTLDLQTDDVVTKANYHYLLRPTREPDVDAETRLYNYTSGPLYGPIYLIPNVSMKAGQSARMQSVQNEDGTRRVRFRGTYVRLDGSDVTGRVVRNRPVAPGVYMLTDEGLMAQTADSTEVGAFSSWIEDVSEDASTPLHFYVDGVCEDITAPTDGIGQISMSRADALAASDDVYDLSGRRIGQRQPITGNLNSAIRPGVYIVGGRKVAIK